MLLCSSSGIFEGWSCDFGARQVWVDLSGYVALEAADDLAFAEALGGASFDVVAGWLVMAHPDDRDDVEGAVRGPVSSAAEAVTSAGASAAGGLGSDSAELGKGRFVADPV